MLTARRFLPSMSLLAAFEAAARTGSVTAASRELDLTQSAVSRQIKALEAQLGVALFVRERQSIRLTLAGQGYAREIHEALRRISTASLNLRANPHGGTLNLAILPTFGARWLAPRLKGFLGAHPGVSVNFVSRLSPFDFRLDSVDAAIHFGHPHWPGAELTFLMSETIAPACSPAFLAAHAPRCAADFLNLPLLHLTSRPDGWERWLAANGVPDATVHGMLFDQFAAATQAAVAGLGIALLPTFLIAEELQRGDLVLAGAEMRGGAEAYYLAVPLERVTFPPLIAFRAWIAGEAARPVG
ncbi:LysR family transcriptional regulator [Rhodovastum atsumiense]|uniref:LysR family transcriptional regulator n=2 Tax=Rhodovastum atsumiense TaxID=504468 RepID=A0A5M6J3G2_9PROT|nr:LysR family transcriptional regulator [Rhodovastum atsumiense]KAA5614205.1 LysR family transcriptional regulator [Rhodovastum atsumiense]CAH2598975.1 LysR family transcriptional regulator [Rhodovastum atsumiense]